MGTRPCKECHRTMEFAQLPEGGSIPLERVQQYRVDKNGVAHKMEEPALISHFRTCRNPDRFSRKKVKAS